MDLWSSMRYHDASKITFICIEENDRYRMHVWNTNVQSVPNPKFCPFILYGKFSTLFFSFIKCVNSKHRKNILKFQIENYFFNIMLGKIDLLILMGHIISTLNL